MKSLDLSGPFLNGKASTWDSMRPTNFMRTCRVCGNKNIRTFFDLGEQPLANSLLKNPGRVESKYPLSLSWCSQCNLVQLNYTVDPSELFSSYLWVTSTSKAAREFANNFCDELLARSGKILKEEYILEVASNDGTFLIPFLKKSIRVLGVDPARNLVNIAKENNIPTKCAFWGKHEALKTLQKYGPAKVIFARNVLPHVANTNDFMKGLRLALDENGTLAIEVHYAKIILEGLHYDSIYHEHLCYFSLKPLEELLKAHGLFIFDMIRSPISGGSIIVYAKKYKAKERKSVEKFRTDELKDRTNQFSSWKTFAKRSFSHRDKLLKVLNKVTAQKKILIGWGASARSSTLLNFCGLNSRIIPVVADQNNLKQKLFTAGSHILIESPKIAMKKKPDVILILAWNFAQEIIETLKNEFKWQGDCIIPFPNAPTIVKKGKKYQI